jgi:hypothetical protein
MRRLDRRERRDLLLQLEHDPLRRLLADPGMDWKRASSSRTIARRARPANSPRRSRARPSGPTPETESSCSKARARLLGEAEELHGVLAHVEMRSRDDLVGAVAFFTAAGVAKSDSRRPFTSRTSPSASHATALPRRREIIARSRRGRRGRRERMADRNRERVGAWWGFGGSASPRIAFTIRCTCAFSARP